MNTRLLSREGSQVRTIIEIQHVHKWKAGEHQYCRTYALLDDGTEAVGFGCDFKVGDEVEVFFHDRYGTIKMRKTPHD